MRSMRFGVRPGGPLRARRRTCAAGRGRVARRRQRGDDVRGVRAGAAQGGRGDAALMRQADVAEPGHDGRDTAMVQRPLVAVERADRCEVVEAGPVAGGQDDGVDVFAAAVAPTDGIAVEAGEHRPSVRVARAQGGAVAAVVDDGRGAVKPAADRRRVQARADQPPVQVASQRPLRPKAQRRPRGQAHARHRARSAAIWTAELPAPTTTTRRPANASASGTARSAGPRR